ncbi:MAG: signal recognition particle-docking protein FtsY [Actinomycetota bacterium]
MEIIIVVALLVVLVAVFVVGLRLRGRPEVSVAEPAVPTGLAARMRDLFKGDRVTDADWERLERALVQADAGTKAARDIVRRVRDRYEPGSDPQDLLVAELAAKFEGDPGLSLPGPLAIVMVVGVNGTGKTTTIGKLARHFRERGRSVALAQSDTFRAAAGEQLSVWAKRADADLVAQERGADAAAVAHDAVEAARARSRDVLIVDTAGRIHTKRPLMDELTKVRRVLEKAAGKQPDEVLLVIDATTGQNGIAQARRFVEAVGVTGIALTKLDGTAKGGIVVAIREELGVPVKLVGTGEGIDDLAVFEPTAFARSLVRG